jgi:hypothetical protein
MKQLITLLSMSLFYIGVYAQNSIPKLLWTLKSVDSEELVGEGTINGRGTCVFDGDLSTYWHTQWQGAAPVQPHEIQLNLGASWLISGFTYTPRSGGGNGTVKGYEFYVSTDGVTWGTAVTTGTFTNTASPTTVTFTGVTGNFVRFRSTSNMQTSAYTSCAELDVLSVNAPAACTVQQIRWGTTGTPLTNLNITWRSQGTAVDSIKWGYTAAYEMGKFAGVKRTNYTDFLFTYTFAAVNAASTIHYIIKDSKTNIWTSDNTYTTAENTTTNLNGRFSFLAMGDSRDDMASWKKIANVQKTSSFTLNNGDLNFDSSGPLYDTWFAAGKSFTDKQLVLYAPGNHEVTNIANFYNQFNLPNNEQWYSFKYGNALFVVINTNDPGNATQLAWLRTTLNDNTEKWKIINFH